ncbi:histone H3.v1-like [Mya arenaria]|uniref:histone H3.v1-like n=1 Tax=Mya arenaria TaxID=6604 RepID=UPI0022E6DB4B|nr:histone H3.v1-like [Mya arenaria]
MTSRQGTAARSQGGKSRGPTQGSRGVTRGSRNVATTRGSQAQTALDEEDEEEDGVTQPGTRGATTTAGGPKSLFDPAAQSRAQGGDDGDGVKADDIWNKFVSDDQDVVRAPTAQTRVTGTRSSQRSRVTGSQEGSQGSKRPSELEEEEEESSEDDDRTIYSDYYLPPAYIREEITEPRAEITDSHEACSCFPNRSDRLRGSMLYDKIVCKHTGLTGHTQPGVFKFMPFWNENMEEPRKLRKRDMRITRTKFVFGYPRPRMELLSESEEDEEEGGEEEDEEEEDARSRLKTEGGKSRKTETQRTARTAKTSKTRATEDDSEYDSEDDEYDDDDDEDDEEDYIPFELPQIGYPHTPSLPPSSQSFRSRYSVYTPSVTDELPPISGPRTQTSQTKRTHKTQFTVPSQGGQTKKSEKTAKESKKDKSKGKAESINSGYDDDGRSRRTAESRQSLPDGPVISTARTFQGKFYDPVTKQVMLYDIGTLPGQRLPVGNIEPMFKPPTAQSVKPATNDQTKPSGSKPGTSESKKSQASHHSAPKAAVLGAVFLSNLLSKNKKNKENFEAGYDEEETPA